MKQKQRVYDYMKRFGSITPMQAIEDIRNDGVTISSEWVKRQNRYGETVKIKRYRLV